jgi:hypothetical protein
MNRLLVSLFATFFIGIVLLFFWSRSLSNSYPDLSDHDILNDTITHIISDGRASARVTFKSQKKYTLPWAKNNQYATELNLPRIVKEGDILIKKQSSDTIILIQDKRKYTFVVYKTIQ